MPIGENKQIKCHECNSDFDAKDNRFFVFSKLHSSERRWPVPGILNILKEWMNYNVVKCPACGAIFKTKELKLLYIFSPLGLLMFIIIIDILIIIYLYIE